MHLLYTQLQAIVLVCDKIVFTYRINNVYQSSLNLSLEAPFPYL